MDTIMPSQQTDTCIKEFTETDFNSTLLEDGTLFLPHTVNTFIDFEGNDQSNEQQKNNNNVTSDTTNNTHIYQNHQNR